MIETITCFSFLLPQFDTNFFSILLSCNFEATRLRIIHFHAIKTGQQFLVDIKRWTEKFYLFIFSFTDPNQCEIFLQIILWLKLTGPKNLYAFRRDSDGLLWVRKIISLPYEIFNGFSNVICIILFTFNAIAMGGLWFPIKLEVYLGFLYTFNSLKISTTWRIWIFWMAIERVYFLIEGFYSKFLLYNCRIFQEHVWNIKLKKAWFFLHKHSVCPGH